MKSLLGYSLAATAVVLSGCVYVDDEAPVRRTVVQETRVVGPTDTVITTLPPAHRVRVYRGTRYYYHNDVYYRARPRGGYVVVGRPW